MFCSDVWLWLNNSLYYFASAVYLLAVYFSLILASSWSEEKKYLNLCSYVMHVLIRKEQICPRKAKCVVSKPFDS